MNEMLRLALQSGGWKSGTHKGFLLSSRAGIEFQVGPARKSIGENGEARLELRYAYHTETTHADGEVVLPSTAGKAEIEDAMTGIYQRVHEKPDMSRVFGRGRKTRQPMASPAQTTGETGLPAAPPPTPAELGQGSFEL